MKCNNPFSIRLYESVKEIELNAKVEKARALAEQKQKMWKEKDEAVAEAKKQQQK